MSPSAPVITATNLTQSFGRGDAQVRALDDVSLDLPRGAWTSIMGPSGSGKTSLLHCLSGLSVPDTGSVELLGGSHAKGSPVDLAVLSENGRARLRRTRIGVIFQEFNLVPVLSVRDNILLPTRMAARRADRGHFRDVVTRLGLDDRLRHLPHQLSGGQRQRVAIARALLMRPDVIFADEPTGNLDSESGTAVLDLFRELVDDYGQTLVVVTHDPSAARRGDHLVTMRDGRIVETRAAGE